MDATACNEFRDGDWHLARLRLEEASGPLDLALAASSGDHVHALRKPWPLSVTGPSDIAV